MTLLRKKLSFFFPCYITSKTTLNLPFQKHKCLLQFSTSLSKDPSPQTHFMVDYLIKSFGLSLDKATKVSKRLTTLKSPQKPDSVIEFLKKQGFNDTQIKSLIVWYPLYLCCKVEKTLEPNIRALQSIGYSGSVLTQFVMSNPRALTVSTVVPRIEFWRTFLRNDQKTLLKAFKENRDLIMCDISGNIAPKISLLHQYGFSDHGIATILVQIRKFLMRNIDTIEVLLKRTEELGFPRESGMFMQALYTVANVGEANFQSKKEVLRSYGWSEQEFYSAFQKSPAFPRVSVNSIRAKMNFFVKKVGFMASRVAQRPVILSMSLQKRLMPRHCVLQVLQSKALVRKELDMVTVFFLTEKMFVEKFILSYKEEVPELHDAYIAACAGRIPQVEASK